MRKLTKREIGLIYIALLLGICCGGYYFIRFTVFTGYREVKSELDLARMEETLAESEWKVIRGLEEELTPLKTYYLEHQADYEPLMAGHEMEQMLLSSFESFGLKPESTLITTPALQALDYSKEKQAAEIYIGSIDSLVKGSIDGFHDFLNVMAQNTSMEVVSFEWADEEKLLENSAWEENHLIRITVRYYMMRRESEIEGIIDR